MLATTYFTLLKLHLKKKKSSGKYSKYYLWVKGFNVCFILVYFSLVTIHSLVINTYF